MLAEAGCRTELRQRPRQRPTEASTETDRGLDRDRQTDRPTDRQSLDRPTGVDRGRQVTRVVTVRIGRQRPTEADRGRQRPDSCQPTESRQSPDRAPTESRQSPTEPDRPTARAQVPISREYLGISGTRKSGGIGSSASTRRLSPFAQCGFLQPKHKQRDGF